MLTVGWLLPSCRHGAGGGAEEKRRCDRARKRQPVADTAAHHVWPREHGHFWG